MNHARRTAALVALAHAFLVLGLCWDTLLLDRVPYVRDVAVLYVPDFAFLAQALDQRVWPLWNPLVDGGRPFLFGYLPDVALVALLGPLGAARAEVPLHLWWAAVGASTLAWARGRGRASVWATGAFYGSSGYVLACGNIFPLLQAAAWAPWVIAAGIAACKRRGRRPVVALALAAAMQVGSLSAELLLQTAAAILVLAWPTRTAGWWARLAGASLLAATLSAPVLLGARAMAAGSAREAGFSRSVTLSWSLRPAELPALVLPRYFGDMHTFSDVGYWGQAVFENGYPYFLSVYLGAVVLLLAAVGFSVRLALLAVAGVLVALGAHGPLAPLVAAVLGTLHARVPAKFLLLTVLAVVSMAGDGVERAIGQRVRAWVMAPGLALAMAGVILVTWPEAASTWLAGLVTVFRDPRALFVVRTTWPADLLRCGLLTLVAGIALWRGGRIAALAALAGAADLLLAGAGLDPTAPPSFYTLREPLRALVEQTRSEGPFRWFSYGAAVNTPLTWRPEIVARNRDRPLFEIEVQSLVPRTQELLALEGVFDEDRTGFAPRGSALALEERRPARFREVYPRLRLGNVRWILGYETLPEDLVRLRGIVSQPEVREPLLLFELREPLPRAFWVAAAETLDRASLRQRLSADPTVDPRRVVLLEQDVPVPARDDVVRPAEEGSVSYDRLDPHTVRLRCSTPPGFIVVLDGYDRGWTARDESGDRPLVRANGRYWAIPTGGGARTIVARFRPAWRTPAFLLAGLGLVAAALLVVREPAAAA